MCTAHSAPARSPSGQACVSPSDASAGSARTASRGRLVAPLALGHDLVAERSGVAAQLDELLESIAFSLCSGVTPLTRPLKPSAYTLTCRVVPVARTVTVVVAWSVTPGSP